MSLVIWLSELLPGHLDSIWLCKLPLGYLDMGGLEAPSAVLCT